MQWLFLKGCKSSILFDPWITFDRFSYNNQYNFPESKFTKEEIKSINPDFIYISHTHADHYDPSTLELFKKKTHQLFVLITKIILQKEI